jgi:GT2 family glycosyltransferase
MSLVSIVIPAFNQARFLGQAVRSALAQTHPWLEVVVVDDGSTDDTADVLREFEGAGNVTVVRQTNGGLPAARNRGLLESRGEFVCFLDSDDVLVDTHISTLLEPLVSDFGLSMVYCDVQFVDVEGQPTGDFSVGRARQTVTGDILESLLVGGYFPPHAMLIRRSALEESGPFDVDLGGHADYELWLRLAAGGHLAHYVDARLAVYRTYEGSMSRNREHMRETRVAALERVARRFPARMASALSAVQELTSDLFSANAWVRSQWQTSLRALEHASAPATWSLLDNLAEAELVEGQRQRFSVWQVPDGAGRARCIYLHPPAALRAVVPTGSAGRLTLSVAVHPQVWENPEASGCVFSVNADDVVVGGVALDPLTRQGDRRWFSLTMDIPASTAGAHVLTLETRLQGTGHFAWGLFRDVQFHMSDRSDAK